MSSNDLTNDGQTAAPLSGRRQSHTVTCAICGAIVPAAKALPVATLRPTLVERIRQDHPGLPADGTVCFHHVTDYRAKYVAELLREERGELSDLDREVVQSLSAGETIAANTEQEYSEDVSFGGRVSDLLAKFGGSWTFIIFFLVVIVVWMAINAAIIGGVNFDPFPFILLNLLLSCLAALQAPVILMSQNRQELKDRMRAENDYQVNLKAELEIRHLHEKMDHLINRQWERLAEIQEIQLEIMQDIAGRRMR
jgi:uncharacterized membrane protein